MIDSRAGRVLTPGERSMVDEGEWEWIKEHATGGFDHLLIGTSLPLFLAPALHYFEAWNEAVCDGVSWNNPCVGHAGLWLLETQERTNMLVRNLAVAALIAALPAATAFAQSAPSPQTNLVLA